MVKYNKVDKGRNDSSSKWIKKLSKKYQKSETSQRPEKLAKAIGLKECLLKNQLSINYL